MSVNKDALWKDLTTQFVGWIKSDYLPNKGEKMFATGYGGPDKPNEETSPADFFAVRDDWKKLGSTVASLCQSLNCQFALPGGRSLGFVVNQSASGYEASSTCDFVCKLDETVKRGNWPSTTTIKSFAYHINVPGIKGCGGALGQVPANTPEVVETNPT